MPRFIFILFFLFSAFTIQAQDASNTYALVIGIKYYEEQRDLQYADRDAIFFAEYLQSEGGGAIPRENIELLTNEEATIANIYMAKAKLEKKVKEGGLVYFYFSGHGDVESSLYELGFLLAADTPNKNYLSNAIRIEDINNMANTLSVLKNVKVILITDACRAGKLSGSDNRGRQLVGKQLSIVQNNEVRIASCDSSQLSHEGDEWGGGRGAFSYYLINGLRGLADEKTEEGYGNGDGQVTLSELKNYLAKKVDQSVRLNKLKSQNPVVKGNDSLRLSVINQEELNNYIQNPSAKTGRDPIQIFTPQNSYFINLKTWHRLRDEVHFSSWNKLNKDQLIDSILTRYPCSYDSLLLQSDWYRKIYSDSIQRAEFLQQFGAFLHNEAQHEINAYLSGAKEELTKRQYYNISNQNFREYSYMMELAEALIDSLNHLHQIVKTKKFYFKGLDDRLQASIIGNNRDSLLERALIAQQSAINLSPKAPYVLNEIGILYKRQNKTKQAVEYYKRASSLIPSWALPQANLSGVYFAERQYDLALLHGKEAIRLQEDNYLAYINYGEAAQTLQNLLLAEECFRKASLIDNNHYQAFNSLASLYSSITKYELSEYYYNEAQKRENWELYMSGDREPYSPPEYYSDPPQLPNIDTNQINREDILTIFVYAKLQLEAENYDISKLFFEKIIRLDPKNPLVFIYLAEIYFRQKEWATAINYLKLAETTYLNRERFDEHFGNQSENQRAPVKPISDFYLNSYFNKQEIYYFLGEAYENIMRFNLSVEAYKKCSEINSYSIVSYLKLLKVYEKQGNYYDAEREFEKFKKYDLNTYNNEIYAFYERLIDQGIHLDLYHYKAGKLLFEIIENEPELHKNLYSYREDIRGVQLDDSLVSEQNLPNYEIQTPGTGTNHIISGSPSNKISKAIHHLTSVETTLEATDKGEIFFLLAELYELLGKDSICMEYILLAMLANPHNQTYKAKYFYILQETNELMKTLAILDSLDQNNSMLIDELEVYTSLLAQSGRSEESFRAFKKLKEIKIVFDSSSYHQEAIAHILANNTEDAIDMYSELDNKYPKNPETNYTLARLYAATDQDNKAYELLERALKLGFNFRYVINNDEYFSELQGTTKWEKLISTYDLQLPDNN